jgi:tight adherence protein B
VFGSGVALLAVIGLAMLSAGGIAYGLLYGRIQNEDTVARRIGVVSGGRDPDAVAQQRHQVDASKRRKSIQETLKELEGNQKAKAKQNRSPPLALRMQQAGLHWSRRTFFIISGVTGLIAFLVPYLLGAPLVIALAFGGAGLLGLPRWFVNRWRKRRLRKFVDAFADAVDVIVRGVKAGLPLNDCVRIIANESAEPVKSEFRVITETQGLGLSLADAVGRLPDRVPTPEASFFAIVVAIQQRAGGNLAEALGNLSRVLRERKKMKGKIGAMAMEAKASAAIIGALPPIVMILVFMTSPGYIMLLFTEPLGHVILGASLVWMTIGVFVMRKMINFDF